MNINENNKVILGQDDSLEPRTSAVSRNCHPRACNARTEELSRIKKGKALSLRGAAGDVAVSCDKALSSRGRAESSDVVISCDKVLSLRAAGVAIPRVKVLSLRGGLMSDEAIFQAETNSVQRLLSRCCKNVEDCRVSAMHFLAMTIPTLTLAAVLAMGIVSESRAESDILYCGDDCGVNCHWEIDSTGVLTVSGTGQNGSGSINDYPKLDSPWKPYLSHVESATISSGITSIGYGAFYNNGLKSINIADTVTYIGASSFQGNLLTSVELPESLRTIEYAAFDTNSLTEVFIPDSVTDLHQYAFSRQLEKSAAVDWNTDENGNYIYTLLNIVVSDELSSFYTEDFKDNPNLKAIYCKGNLEKCKNNFAKIGLADLVVPAGNKQCVGSSYYWSGSSCNNKKNGIKCAENWKQVESWCNRVRYTPADAAKVLKNDDNEIIMTFKVNR